MAGIHLLEPSTRGAGAFAAAALEPTTAAGDLRRRSAQIPRLLIWLARAASWSLLVAACVHLLLVRALGDTWWVATIAIYAPRWPLLIPIGFAAGVSAVCCRRLLWVNLLSVAIVLGPLMGFCLPLSLGGPKGSAHRLRVLTANGGGASGERLGQIIAAENPDIVALQEFNGEALAELLGPGWHRSKLYGVSILSRFPLSETAGFSGGSVGRFGNVAVRVSAETPFGPVWICNLHLNTPRWGFEELAITRRGILGAQAVADNTALRDDESRQIRAWVDEVEGPKIILGDMNMPIESAIYRRYWSSFTDAYSAAGFGYGLTKFSHWFGVRIDHVLVTDAIRVTKCKVAGPTGGDHRPVIADLVFDAS